MKDMEQTMRENSMRIIVEISEISTPHTFFALATGKITHVLIFCSFPPAFFAKH
jgi:hypothetical protein